MWQKKILSLDCCPITEHPKMFYSSRNTNTPCCLLMYGCEHWSKQFTSLDDYKLHYQSRRNVINSAFSKQVSASAALRLTFVLFLYFFYYYFFILFFEHIIPISKLERNSNRIPMKIKRHSQLMDVTSFQISTRERSYTRTHCLIYATLP